MKKPDQKVRRTYSLILLLILLSIELVAQPELGVCKQEADPMAEAQLPKALRAWRKKDFREAQRYLEKSVGFDRSYAHGHYLLGELYLKKGELHGVEAMWEQVIRICPDYKADLYYYLGILLLETNKEKRGRELLETYVIHAERDAALVKEAENILEEFRVVEELKAHPVPYDPKPVPGISTPADEYLGCISPDMHLFFFTRRLRKRNKYSGPANGMRLVEEFSMSQRQQRGFPAGEALPRPFNSQYNEGGPSITAANSELFFTVCQPNDTGYLNCDIWYSRRFGSDWSSLRPLPAPINSAESWESQPSVSANGDLLFFASNRKRGYGGTDLYVCHRLENGDWSAPENLGQSINTEGNEKTPFLHSDSRTLYFSSDGHPGMGGFDIFYSRQYEGVWQSPKNIGYPINNESNNVGLFVDLSGKKAYFSTKRKGGRKDYDIFSFDMPAAARPVQVALIRGTVADEAGAPQVDARLELTNLKTKEVQRIGIDELDGSYTAAVRVSNVDEHLLTIKQEGSAFQSRFLSKETITPDEESTVQIDMEVLPLEKNREYRLRDIYFASNSAELNHSSLAVLQVFRDFLVEHPNVHVEIQGHTDEVGSASANLKLSSRRATKVYEHLIDEGVDPGQMQHRGYGESRPAADNTTEEGKALNRRTVFVITSQ